MKKNNFQYREAVNGLEALKLYQAATSPRFDAVLMGTFISDCNHRLHDLTLHLATFLIAAVFILSCLVRPRRYHILDDLYSA
jgi:hypothetical protein